MDLIENEINNINGSRAYFWKSNKIEENLNFHDYQPKNVEFHLIIEGSIEGAFKQLIKPEVKGLSVITSGNIDLSEVKELIPHLEVLYLQCESISQVDVLNKFVKLNTFSLTSSKNQAVNFHLPNQLKSFSCTWKEKFQFIDFSNSLEYLFIEKAKKIDFKNLIKESKSLIKLELIDCNLSSCIDEIFDLKFLRYLSLVKSSELGSTNQANLNTSLKYLNLSKVKLIDIEWISKFSSLDILILEDCGDIKTLNILGHVCSLRGVWLAGNTKSIDGDLTWLNNLSQLENLFIREYPHYSHKSVSHWSWGKFGKGYDSNLFTNK
jgi:hypothetical protein